MTSIHETPTSRAKAQDLNTSSLSSERIGIHAPSYASVMPVCGTHNPTDSARLGTPIHPEIVRTDHTPTRPLGHSGLSTAVPDPMPAPLPLALLHDPDDGQ